MKTMNLMTPINPLGYGVAGLNIFKELDQTPRNFVQAYNALDDVNKTTINNFIDKTKYNLYLKEDIVQKLLLETNFEKLRHYSLYQKAFRTYSKSKISSMMKVSYKNPKISDDSQDIIDDVLGG